MRFATMRRVAACGCVAALAATMVLGGCAAGGADENANASSASDEAAQQGRVYTFTDDTGAEVVVKNPQRVVACMGSFASVWELAGGTLVGASDDSFTLSNYELVSKDVQKVGDFSSLNLESIIALEPDFVIMTSASGGRGGDSNQTDLKAALESSGIAVASFQVTTFDDYLRMLRTCCDITGRDDLYQQNGQVTADKVAAIKAQVPAGEAPTALVLTTYSGGTRVQSSSTMTGSMLSDLGVKNLADENPSLLKDFSLESVIEMNPDYLFVVPMGNDNAAAMKALEDQTAANPAWSTLSAVQNGTYLTLDPHLFQYKPNERWDQSYQALYDALYA